jgi:DTW domain-containing protein YfiP
VTEGRPTCARCRRPLQAWVPGDGQPVAVAGGCFCDRIVPLPTRTRILLLQHPRERRVGVGTARLAHLALPSSSLRVGVDFSDDPGLQVALRGRACVLFPGPSATPVADLVAGPDLTLIVLDGTWANARTLLGANPALAALPRVSFQPRRPSAYEIRRQPAPFCVSTIEALAEVLQVLEPEGGPFDRLLEPFRAMVERQRWFETAVRSFRHAHRPRPAGGPRARLAARLAAAWPHLVCVQGEANAWPRSDPRRQPPETVHWLAHRPATGETLATVVAPRRPLAPSTPSHVRLNAETILAGQSVEEWRASWNGFVREGDELVVWGNFYPALAASEGLALPPLFDLRLAASRALRQRLGTVEECAAALGASAATLGLAGRGGGRLEALVGALRALRVGSSVAVKALP